MFEKRKIGRYFIILLMAVVVYVLSFFALVITGIAMDSRYSGFCEKFYAPIAKIIISDKPSY